MKHGLAVPLVPWLILVCTLPCDRIGNLDVPGRPCGQQRYQLGPGLSFERETEESQDGSAKGGCTDPGSGERAKAAWPLGAPRDPSESRTPPSPSAGAWSSFRLSQGASPVGMCLRAPSPCHCPLQREGSAPPARPVVTVRVLPAEVWQSPLYTVTPEGGSINITCSVRVNGTLFGVHLRQSYLPEMRKVTYYESTSAPTVDARFEGRVVFSGTTENLTITIQRLRPEDTGAYFCEAIAEDGQGWGSGTTVVVTGRQCPHPWGRSPPCQPGWFSLPLLGRFPPLTGVISSNFTPPLPGGLLDFAPTGEPPTP